MKTSALFRGVKSIRRFLFVFPLAALSVFCLLFFSCASFGTVARIGAAVGQAAGVIDADTADAVTRSGDAIGKAYEEITPEQEYYIGRAVGANILAGYKLYTAEPALTAYINRICGALVVNSPRPEIFNGYHANILDSDEINAFSTPGGHIFITRGLLGMASSEDTLAAVIAHEIGHIQLEHGLKSIKNSRFNDALIVTATSAAGAALDIPQLTSAFKESIGEVVTTMMNNGYTQPQEFEADTTGMQLLALAGYEPLSLLEMLRALEKNQSAHPGGFNKTHPTPAQRIASAEKTSGSYNIADTRSFREARYRAVNQ